jgi:hypothetical protein
VPGLHGVHHGLSLGSAIRPAPRGGAGDDRAPAFGDAFGHLLRVPLPPAAAGADRAAADASAFRTRPPDTTARTGRVGVAARAAGTAADPDAGAGRGAGTATRRGGDADRVRAVRVLPAGERGDRASARVGGMRRDHPAGPGVLRRPVVAFRPDAGGRAVLRTARVGVRASGRGHDRGELGRLRLVDETRDGGRTGLLRVPGFARHGGPAASAAGDGRVPRRLPPAARAADLGPAARVVAFGAGTFAGRAAGRGKLLRIGWGLQPAPALGRRRARVTQGRRGGRLGRVPGDLGQPGLFASDRRVARRPGAFGAGRAHRGGAGRLHPRRLRVSWSDRLSWPAG